MRLLLTGATGFIGSCLARRLVAESHEVAIVVRPTSDLAILGKARERLAVHTYDGGLPSMIVALEASQPDIVIHVASLFVAQHKPADVEPLIASNIDMPVKLLEAMVATRTTRLINTGTSWQHYRDAPFDPANLYASTKQAFEDILAFYVAARGLRALTLKLFDTYGPGDARPKLFSLLRRTALSGNPLKMSPGEQLIDLVYIDDVLDAYMRAISQFEGIAAGSYAISNSDRLSLREIVRVYGEVTGRPLNIEWAGLPYRPREALVPWRPGCRFPGWSPQVPLREGIRRMEIAAGMLNADC